MGFKSVLLQWGGNFPTQSQGWGDSWLRGSVASVLSASSTVIDCLSDKYMIQTHQLTLANTTAAYECTCPNLRSSWPRSPDICGKM